MDTRKEALKYINKYFKHQFFTDKDREVRALIRLLNKAKKQKPSAEERFEVKKDGEVLKVLDTKKNVWITIPLPSIEIEIEITEDFNKMENKDFTPLGLPNFSNNNQNSSAE